MTALNRHQPATAHRIVFFGDSITEEGNAPDGYVDQLRHALAGKASVIGAGISGNKVPDLQARLDRDVLPHTPTIVVVYIGINDVWHDSLGLHGTPITIFEQGLRDVIARIQATGAHIILCTPSVIGEKPDGSNMHDPDLDRYANVSRSLAAATGCTLCDLRQAFIAYLRQHNPGTHESGILTRDAVHLTARGNTLVAEALLPRLSAALAATPPRIM
jgi:lysophospholipase L1-like esterase